MAVIGRNRKPGVDASSGPPETGWPALHKTVRDADVTKVDDCREDIDTLLVFAGLYSAVLTAFVVESYTHLQQDPQDVIIGLLQQIATRNFVSGPGFINSTTTSTIPPPFEPPLWAIRVNVLWFTSLLLSLTSASFGILVKQWLREYLAIEYTVPQQRLRARQYRNPALSQWKVFEIAAFLPLLLQLSLGLFFAGLCFFTAAVQTSIGRTTTSLVCAWAFLLFVTTIAPLFSPRCPFKTTFLKQSLKAARRYVSSIIHCVAPLGRLLVFVVAILLFHPVYRPILGAYTAVSYCFKAARLFRRTISRGLTSFGALVSSGCHALGTWLLLDVTDWMIDIPWSWVRYPLTAVWFIIALPCQATADMLKLLRKRDLDEAAAQEEEEKEEEEGEEDVVKQGGDDAEILLSVDVLMSDDGLLPIMLDALRQQLGAMSENVVRFISQIIGRRIGSDLGMAPRIAFVPDLRSLSKLAWSTLTDTIADLLQHGSGPLHSDSPDWVFNSVMILLSPSLFELSDSATQTLHWVSLRSTQEPECRCSDAVHRSIESGTDMCLRRTMDAWAAFLCQDTDHTHSSLGNLLNDHKFVSLRARRAQRGDIAFVVPVESGKYA